MVKKIPERKCLGCGEKFKKQDLLRVVRTPDNDVMLDLGGKQNGRGVYVCKNTECLKKVIKGDKLSRGLDVKVTEEIYAQIARFIESGGASGE